MMTMTCKLTLPDGAAVTATLKAASPEGEFPVAYQGPVERLPESPAQSDTAFLLLIMNDAAQVLGATIEINYDGQFERFAE
jgi:hypothetical protein